MRGGDTYYILPLPPTFSHHQYSSSSSSAPQSKQQKHNTPSKSYKPQHHLQNPPSYNNMQTMLNLNSSYGLPVSVSGITSFPLSFPREMVDHDRRRKAMKKRRSRGRDQRNMVENNYETVVQAINEGLIHGDIADLLFHHHQLSFTQSNFSHTAKAA